MAAGIPAIAAAPEIERRTVSKVSWRLLPLIVVIYFVAYMDRTNVGFASFGLNREFGFSADLYGWGAGIFFLGYFLFEVPSNVLLERTGARIWIARIMITWGLIAGGMAFIAGPVSFLVMRFLLGVAEAGLLPRHDPVLHLLVPAEVPGPGGGGPVPGGAGLERPDRR